MDAILITTGTITDDLTVARIFRRTCTSVDNIVVIQIFIQDITRIRIVAFHFWNACFQLAIGIEIINSIQAVCNIPPDFTQFHTYTVSIFIVLILAEETCLVIILGNLGFSIIKVEAQIVFHFSDLIIPVYSDLPSFGTKIGSILQRSTCTQHSR